jgi:hypothetical protein
VTSSLLDVRRGSQTPRVSNYPPYDVSAAPEFIELAEFAGLVLDDWQKYVLTHGLGQHLDGSWTARKASVWVPRQNGKGGIIEALELGWLFITNEDLIVHTSHQHRTSKRAYLRLERILRGCPSLHRKVKSYRQANGEQRIELHGGRLLEYATRSGVASRGYSAPKLILDEAQELTSDHIAAIMPTLSAMPNYQGWFFGTPPDDPTAWAYNLKEDGEAGVPRLAHFDWGADLDLEDPEGKRRALSIDLAYACNPAMGIRISQETVEDEMKPSGLGEKYPQERLGYWQSRATSGSGVISDEQWKKLVDKGSSRPAKVALSVDINPARTHTAIVACGPRDDGRMVVSVVDYRAGTSWVAQRVAELKANWNPVAIAMDLKGPVGSLVLELDRLGVKQSEDPSRPRRGDLAIPSVGQVAGAFGMFVDAVRQELIRHADEGPLNVALAGAKVRALAGGSAWDHRRSVDISPLVAATFAYWAYVTRAETVGRYNILDSFY